MKSYKDFEKVTIGYSDIVTLVVFGCREDGLAVDMLNFGSDGIYNAYLVDEADVEIGEHYKKVANFKNWMKIYDDHIKSFEIQAKEINVYMAGEFGCIIQAIGCDTVEIPKDAVITKE